MLNTIRVTYEATSKVYQANQWLRKLAAYPIIACDFEVAKKYTQTELDSFKEIVEDDTLPKQQRMTARSKLKATALDHPSHTVLTHLSIAWSESESYVFILDNPAITRRVLEFLVTTRQKQIWHNAGYDFRQIQYRTGRFPIDYEDTQIFTKTLVNHVNIHKATSGLKELAGTAYGAWGISIELFTIEQMYEPKMLLYSATDPCATMWVWNRITDSIEGYNPNDNYFKDFAVEEIAKRSNPSAEKYVAKEQFKAERATQFIGEGTIGSSTHIYRTIYEELGKANTGTYTSDDIVFVASNGKRPNRINPVIDDQLQGMYQNINHAIEASASFIMDTTAHLEATKSYNIGELALAEYLYNKGYVCIDKVGKWIKKI